jgi:F-type H+-transporting ATPase subunit c
MTRKTVATLGAFLTTLFVASMAFAQEGAHAALSSADAFALFGAGLCIALAAMGCGLAQGRASAAALEGIARNPGASGAIFTPMILGLALIESLAIYALLISFQIIGKVG